MSNSPRFIAAGLLAFCGTASLVFALQRAHESEAEVRYARFYSHVLRQEVQLSGPPMVKVLSADRREPVANVIVGMTLIGPDGGDGGFHCFVTDESGVAYNHRQLPAGRYQHSLMPDPKSGFARTSWTHGQPFVVVSHDGTTSVPSLLLDVKTGG